MRTDINHWLYRENIPCPNLRTLARLPIIRNLRVFVHLPANAMSDVFADDRIAVRFGMALDRIADVSEVIACATLVDCQLQTFFSHANQSQQVIGDIADRDSGSRIAYEPFES